MIRKKLINLISSALLLTCLAGPAWADTSGEQNDTIEDGIDPSKLDFSDSYYLLYRNKDAKEGGYCSYKGSVLIRMDINEDGFEDMFCKDIFGLEEVTSGLRLFYGFPAVRSRMSTLCLQKAITFDVLPKARVIICNSNANEDGYTYMDFHRYLKPLF